MRTSIEIMTSVSDETYYSRFSSQFLGSLKTATENVPLCCDVDFILLIGVLKSGLTEEFKDKIEFQVDLYLKDRVKLHIVALDSIPGRNSLLYSNSIQASYYTFIDFDDEVHPHYFKNFLDAVKVNKSWDYIIGHAVRKDGDTLIPKDYLKWRPTTSMSKFFLNGEFGNNIWGRFFSDSLIQRILKSGNYSLQDNTGFGEEWNLHNQLFFSALYLGSCDSLYYWNYGDRNTLSKTIDVSVAKENIEKALEFVPDRYKEPYRERYEKLLDLCLKSSKEEK